MQYRSITWEKSVHTKLYGVVWYGVVWCGAVWCGAVWCGVVWYDYGLTYN